MRLKIGKKLKTASHSPKFTDSYKKERKYMHIILLWITVKITYIFCLFLDREQTNYSKIGKVCLFMMYKLNVKWPVT